MAKRTPATIELLLAKESLKQAQDFKDTLQGILNLITGCASLEIAAQRIFIISDKKIPRNAKAHEEAIGKLEALRNALQLPMNDLIALYTLTCVEEDRQDHTFLAADDRLNGKWAADGEA